MHVVPISHFKINGVSKITRKSQTHVCSRYWELSVDQGQMTVSRGLKADCYSYLIHIVEYVYLYEQITTVTLHYVTCAYNFSTIGEFKGWNTDKQGRQQYLYFKEWLRVSFTVIQNVTLNYFPAMANIIGVFIVLTNHKHIFDNLV